jgi:beta-N-acetylhexosaminidase
MAKRVNLLRCCCALALLVAPQGYLAQRTTAQTARPISRLNKPSSAASASPLLAGLSLHDRIAQLIIVRGYGDYPPSDSLEYKRFLRWIRQDHVGGFIIAGRIRDGSVVSAQPFETAVFVNHLQHLAKTPLLVASDFERGASMRVAETAKFPYLMAFGAARDAKAIAELGAATAREARALGVNWIFAPDADVNNNPANPIINMRSFGEDPHAVAAGVSAFIEGAHSDPRKYVLVTAKHFPGQGDTTQDTHMQFAALDQPKERLEAMELIPFRAAVEHGVDAIMTAHLLVPAFEPEPVPATVSRNVLTGLLHDELGFRGLVVTDALEMQGVASLLSEREAAVRAISAGADVLLMPIDPETCIRAIESAVASGRLSRRRIDESAAKVLAAKRRLGLYRNRFVNLDELSDELDVRQTDRLAQRVADEAVTLVKDDKHLFPISDAAGSCLVILNESAFSQRGAVLARVLATRVPSLKTYVTDASMGDSLLSAMASDISHCNQIYTAAFITVAANRGSVALQGGLSNFLSALLNGSPPVALISLGNPYLLADFPSVSAYLATFSTAVTSEIAAANAIAGDIAISGRLPVSIPGIAKLGEGMDVARKRETASNPTQ